ncbi:hypothetical protein C2845_PM09G14000 [Panicum miliaceum]|uniref:MULE transposase domain-containing protein n=1 Tax=Panicum miliaceum TaxID=4540 RepID=A0A3L6S4N2_PANMI|nr:hypothetical protein C2845_PM09G14000 [Panicum miliaceum]
MSSLVEEILGFTNYRVMYGKAWRAKQHAMAMLWGDWKDAYGRVPRLLHAISHYNLGTKWCTHTTSQYELYKGVLMEVTQSAYWCFPQCAEAFKHCKSVISVDGTFLTRKYRGALLIATGMDREDRLIPQAFSLVESENNESWSWFSHLVWRDVVGLDRKKNKKVIKQLKLVCASKPERTFGKRLAKLKEMMNEDANECNTNISEVLNKVLKGIRCMPVSAIVEFTFYRVNSYFVKRWQKAKIQIERAPNQVLWAKGAAKLLTTEEEKAKTMAAVLFEPTSYVRSVRTSNSLTIGGESIGGRVFKVDLTEVPCTCCVPHLLHVPCSYMIAACQAPRFEPILDPSDWPPYNGGEYIPDSSKMKVKAGRWKKKHLLNEMYASNGYGDDMYSYGDFNQDKSNILCGI